MHSDAELGSFSATRFQNLIEGYLNGSTASTLGDAMFVNLPQFLVSCAYLLYNSMFTDMQLAVEYTRFAQHAKALRISDPKGAQRSTYWLQLPFKYSLPLMAVMSLLHWLISEALYMVDIAFVWPDGSSDENAHVVSAGEPSFPENAHLRRIVAEIVKRLEPICGHLSHSSWHTTRSLPHHKQPTSFPARRADNAWQHHGTERRLPPKSRRRS